MTSKISFFNMMREDLKHRIWMLALSCLGSFLALPIAFLMSNMRYMERMERLSLEAPIDPLKFLQDAYTGFFYSTAGISQGIILFLGALIVGIFGFRFLYSRQMTDLYHSLPVKRSRLFFTIYLNGLLIWLLPVLAFMLITLILMFFLLGAPSLFPAILVAAGKMLLRFLLAFLTVYHFILLCGMLCGNVFSVLCTGAIAGTGIMTLYAFIGAFSDKYFHTFVELPLDWHLIAWLSPLVSPFLILGSTGNDAGFVLLCLLLLALNLAGAYLLYKRRPSELAEAGILSDAVQKLFRIPAAFFCGLAGALIFSSILGNTHYGWILFGILLFGSLSFGVFNIIFNRSFRSFLHHKLEMGVTLLSVLLFFAVFVFDLTGFDTRFPDREETEAVSIRLDNFFDDSYAVSVTADGTILWDHNAFPWWDNPEEQELLYALASALSDRQTDERTAAGQSQSITISVSLTNGGSFVRRYQMTRDDLELLRPVVESEAYRSHFYKASGGSLPLPSSLDIESLLVYHTAGTSDTEIIRDIMEAYAKDFNAHYTLEELESGMAVVNLQPVYTVYDIIDSTYSGETKEAQRISVSEPPSAPDREPVPRAISYLPVFDYYTNTLSVLRKHFPDLILSAESFTPQSLMTDSTQEAISQDELKELMSYLHFGTNRNQLFTSEEYYYVGQLLFDHGTTLSCYARYSELPEQWRWLLEEALADQETLGTAEQATAVDTIIY